MSTYAIVSLKNTLRELCQFLFYNDKNIHSPFELPRKAFYLLNVHLSIIYFIYMH